LSTFQKFIFHLVWLQVIVVGSCLGEDLLRGAFTLLSYDGPVEVAPLGEPNLELATESLPQVLVGHLVIRAETRGELLLRGSNGSTFFYKGPGYFAIERFEQTSDFKNSVAGSIDQDRQSRMIMNLRSGTLLLDSRELSTRSQLIVETPVGRISGKNALWMADIGLDAGKGMYSFNLQCLSGRIVMIDLSGVTYTVQSGQRLSGVGASSSPSVELAKITNAAESLFEDFLTSVEEKKDLQAPDANIAAAMTSIMLPTPRADTELLLPEGVLVPDDKRPIIIEYAPKSKSFTAFRGELSLPKAVKDDHF